MKTFSITLLFAVLALVGCQQPSSEEALKAKAQELAQKFIIVDTHVDVPYRLREKMEDISVRTAGGDFDYVRAKEGGLNAPFMSIYVPSEYENKGAKALADTLIDMVEKLATDWPDKFAIAKSVADVRAQFAQGLISLPMGMENGAPLEGNLENLKHFYERGIRYLTLTHGQDNHICDSSYDTTRTWHGLSPFGKEVVAGMNRLGIMIDVSHISDDAFYHVMEHTKAPVIASHSSCRFFTPGWERNMDDEMIKRLAQNGGVVQINFGSSFINDTYRKTGEKLWQYFQEHQLNPASAEGKAFAEKFKIENKLEYADITEVVAHIDHVIKLVGVDHVGLGSDFDGVGDSLPIGLKSVSDYPNLIAELLKKGYSEEDIEKICSGNVLRVWSQVEEVAQQLQASN
ncbi:membrane dipeptidase [candidate division KSB1 bacterium]|nr:membrane dipeptidase [candidate division KSB1 bacterium]